jgi:hypothetical protein
MVCGAGDLPDGSLLFLEGSNKPVSTVTRSEYTHVALVRNIGGRPWVYEATPAKVRRVTLDTYLAELADQNRDRQERTRLWAYAPRTAYSPRQQTALARYTDAQIGRRYSVKGYLRGRDVDGIHCADFAATALESTGRFDVERGYAFSPGVLLQKVRGYYQPPHMVRYRQPPVTASVSWCERSWKQWAAAQRWCDWVAVEAWMFCW